MSGGGGWSESFKLWTLTSWSSLLEQEVSAEKKLLETGSMLSKRGTERPRNGSDKSRGEEEGFRITESTGHHAEHWKATEVVPQIWNDGSYPGPSSNKNTGKTIPFKHE